MEKDNIYIVMPAYNEEETILDVVAQWHRTALDIQASGADVTLMIANDGSNDNTMAILNSLTEKYPLLVPIDKPNSGHGPTLFYLYGEAINRGADFIFQTDSDGQTDPSEIWPMWEQRHSYDFQIGHRSHRKDGRGRIFAAKVLKLVVRATFGVNVIDANAPFRLMRASALKSIMEVIPQDFFLTNVAISAIAVKKGLRCRWIPITFRQRQGGVNSINIKRIFMIGYKAIGELHDINKNI
ncbi:MAG: glycosyltransferase family 2 protein [Muribaculaceae bacterium]